MMTLKKRASILGVLALLAVRSLAHAGYFADGDMIEGYSTIVSSGSSTVLSYNSARNIKVTGSTTHIFHLPSGLATRVGKSFNIQNASTGSVTVKDYGANTIATLLAGEYAKFLSTSAASANGSWNIQRPSAGIGGSASMAAEFDSGGNLVSDANVSTTELGFLDGVTSSLCGVNQSCTVTNKTLTSPVLTGSVSGGVLYANGSSTISTHSGLTYNGSGTLTATTFSGALTGTASGNLQATANQYGVLLSGSGNTATVLAPDASTTKVLTSGGTSANPSWQSVGTAPQQSYEISNVGLSASVAANAITIALKQSDGSTNCSTGAAACLIGFRNGSSTVGGFTQRSVTGSLSVTVSSGSTLGQVSAVAEYVYVYAIDNAGTVELAASTGLFIDQGSVVTTTAEGGAGAADSRSTIYSTTARASVPVRLIGRVKSTQATAGTWATSPSEVSLSPLPNASVASNSGGLERIERASITNSGTPAVSTQSGAWISSVSDTAVGRFTLNIPAGIFSAAPVCVCVSVLNSSGVDCQVWQATTTTAVVLSTHNAAGAEADFDTQVICMGPR